MIPGSFVVLPAMPLTPSGKIDRGRLPNPPRSGQRSSRRPSTPTERKLGELWRQLLDLEVPPGADDAFFDVGGHSLLAVQLFVEIERLFGVDLPLAQIFDTPTLGELAAAIDDGNSDHGRRPGGSAVLLSEGPAGAPTVFWVPGGGGATIGLARLATEMTGRVTFFGLEAPGQRPDEAPCRTVQELASVHLTSIERHWRGSSLVIGGTSFGGLVAYQLATMLEARGSPPDQLVIVDTFGPLEQARRIGFHWKARVLEVAGLEATRVAGKRRLRRSATSRLKRVRRASQVAARRFVPTHACYCRVCIVTTDARVDECGDPLLGWGEHLLGQVECVKLPGGHNSLIEGDSPARIAEAALQRVATSASRSARKRA